MKKIIEGIAHESEYTDDLSYYISYGDVSNSKETLTDILKDEFLGKKVRVTIEEIE